MHTRTSRRSGFTLIELLVVIAIIAILAAILFPVFAKAREKARQTSCLSNLKQINLAVIQYTQDYDGLLPWTAGLSANPNLQLPAGQARPDGLQFNDLLAPYTKNTQLFFCPSISQTPQAHLAPAGLTYKQIGTTYLYNAFTDHFATKPGYIIAGESIDSALDAVKAPLVWDDPCCGASTGALESWWKIPHNDGINVAYADGHAKWAHVGGAELWCCVHLWEGWKSVPFS